MLKIGAQVSLVRDSSYTGHVIKLVWDGSATMYEVIWQAPMAFTGFYLEYELCVL